MIRNTMFSDVGRILLGSPRIKFIERLEHLYAYGQGRGLPSCEKLAKASSPPIR